MTVNVMGDRAIGLIAMSVNGSVSEAIFTDGREKATPAERKKAWDSAAVAVKLLLDLVEDRRDVINP